MEYETKKLCITFGIAAVVAIILGIIVYVLFNKIPNLFEKSDSVEVTINNEVNYSDVSFDTDYEGEGQDFVYDMTEPYASVKIDETYTEDYVVSTKHLNYMTEDDRSVALLNEQEAWLYISNNRYNDYQSGSYASHESELKELKSENLAEVTVRVRTWEDPTDQDNLTKVTADKTFEINSRVADSFEHIMQDIYNDPSQPVINLGDRGMGTWVLRGKNHNPNRSMSAHALGCCIDINPSTGSFYVNDTAWYGNGYGQHVMTKQIWEQLPECQRKYNVLYDGCPIVEIFKAYGWYWGGDWSSTKDPMHLGYLGDGSAARSTAINNYNISSLNK